MGFSVFIKGIILGHLYGSTVTPMAYPAIFAVALGFGVGAAVIMKIRKDLE